MLFESDLEAKKPKTITGLLKEKGLSNSQIILLMSHILKPLIDLDFIKEGNVNGRDKYIVVNETETFEVISNNDYFQFYKEINQYTPLSLLFIEDGLRVNAKAISKHKKKLEELIEMKIIKRVVNEISGYSVLVVCDKPKLIEELNNLYTRKSQYTSPAPTNFYLKEYLGFTEDDCKRLNDELYNLNPSQGVENGKITNVDLFLSVVKNTRLFQFIQYSKQYKTLNGVLKTTEKLNGVHKTKDLYRSFSRVFTINKKYFVDENIVKVFKFPSKKAFIFIVDEKRFLDDLNSFSHSIRSYKKR